MKPLNFLLLFLSLVTVLNAQTVIPKGQILVQNVDLVIDYQTNISTTIHDVSIYVENDFSQNFQTAEINLLTVDKQGRQIGVLETLNFTEIGEKSLLRNESQYYEYVAKVKAYEKELTKIGTEKEAIRRAITRAEEGNDQTYLNGLQDRAETLLEEEEEIRDLLVNEENPDYLIPVQADWLYGNTYEKFLSLLDGYNLNEQGMQLIFDWVMYRANEDEEIVFNAGKVGDYFVESSELTVVGDFTNDSADCYVLGQNQSLTVTGDRFYKVGRQGLCTGRTNVNNDSFKILDLQGNTIVPLSQYGLNLADNGEYYPFDENWYFTITQPFVLEKGADGQFMVFAILAK